MEGNLLRYIILTAAVIVIGAGASVAAQNSRLTQEITGVDCVANPSDPECPPTIQSIVINEGRPILRGRYNSAVSNQLRVTLNGVTYTLGVDSQLTAAGDNWDLDLSELDPALSPGDYSVLVESMDVDGNWLSNSELFTVPIVQPDDGGEQGGVGDDTPGEDDDQIESGWLGDTGDSVVLALAGAVTMIVLAMVLIGSKRKRKKSKK